MVANCSGGCPLRRLRTTAACIHSGLSGAPPQLTFPSANVRRLLFVFGAPACKSLHFTSFG
jgi:hypothetical protein